jgi:hypothetical protein
MIIKREIDGVKYEANLEGHLTLDGETALQGLVVVHDPDKAGGRRRAWIQADGSQVLPNYVVICKAAFK